MYASNWKPKVWFIYLDEIFVRTKISSYFLSGRNFRPFYFVHFFRGRNIRPDEIGRIIREQIDKYDQEIKADNIGIVLQVGDGIARVYGLDQVMSGELLEFEDEDKTIGIALNLENDNVGVVLMGNGRQILEGSLVKATGQIAQIPVGDSFLGRVVNPLAVPIDGKGEIKSTDTRLLEAMAPGIISRK